MAAHRYWRVFIDSGNSGNISASHIEFHDTIGGANLCTGGVGYASSTYSGFDPNGVFAGTQMWASSGGAPQFIAYDFGVGVTHEIVEIAWQSRTDGYNSQTPNVVHVEYSDDNSTWIPAGWGGAFGDASTWGVGQFKFIYDGRIVPAFRAWRLVGATPIGGHENDGMGLCAMDWKDSGGTSLMSGPSHLSASNNDTSGPFALAEAINSGTGSGTGWYTGNQPFIGQFIAYDFVTPVAPVTVEFCSLNSFVWTIGTALTIQGTNDDPTDSGAVWKTQRTLSGLAGHDDTVQSFPLATPPPPAEEVSKLAAYVVEGPLPIPEQVSKLATYVIEGSNERLLSSKLAVYVVIGPPPLARRLGVAVF